MEPSQVRREECRQAGWFCKERAGLERAGLWHRPQLHLRALPCREVRRWVRAEGSVPGLRVLRYGSGTTSWTAAFLQLLPETQPQQRRAQRAASSPAASSQSCERCSLPSFTLGEGTAAARPLDPHLLSPSTSLHSAQLIAPRLRRARPRTRPPSHRSHLVVRPRAAGAHCSLGAPSSRGEARNPLKQEGEAEQRG